MLAGRTLLLADDSITIQKIVALTFADEGIEVVAVSDGAEAIEKLEEISPDVVLADIFMPRMSGYQVCEHIKQAEHLKHIPVMLLVGSFEPFDEAEARRVGADDTLTKPFQSIRTLVDKVGALMGRTQAADHVEEVSVIAPDTTPGEEPSGVTPAETEAEVRSTGELEADTRELPPPELVQPPEEPMTVAELEVTTADTQPLSPEMRQHIEQSSSDEVRKVETVWEAEIMHTDFDTDVSHEPSEGFGEALLDLGQFEPAGFLSDDEGILDIDFDAAAPQLHAAAALNVQTAVAADTIESPTSVPTSAPGFVEDSVDSLAPGEETVAEGIQTDAPEFVAAAYAHVETVPEVEGSFVVAETELAFEDFQQPERMDHPEMVTGPLHRAELLTSEDAAVSTPAGLIKLEQVSPEVIDAIARRAVALLSEKVVQEIAWEVVPQLADLMIKRMLEERESQNK